MADLPNNPVPRENYPSASQDGLAIPLAAVRPIGSISLNLPGNSIRDIELPEDVNLVSLFSTSQGTLYLPNSTLSGDYQSNSFVFLPEVMYELVLDRTLQVSLAEEGNLIINILMKWGQMRNIGSYYVS